MGNNQLPSFIYTNTSPGTLRSSLGRFGFHAMLPPTYLCWIPWPFLRPSLSCEEHPIRIPLPWRIVRGWREQATHHGDKFVFRPLSSGILRVECHILSDQCGASEPDGACWDLCPVCRPRAVHFLLGMACCAKPTSSLWDASEADQCLIEACAFWQEWGLGEVGCEAGAIRLLGLCASLCAESVKP